MDTYNESHEYALCDFLQKSEDCIYVFDYTDNSSFRIVAVNSRFEREFGIKASQCIGMTSDDILSYDVAVLVNLNLQLCVDSGNTLEGNVELEMPGGKRLYHTTFVPVRDSGGLLSKVMVVKREQINKNLSENKSLLAGDYKSSVIIPSIGMNRAANFIDFNSVKRESENLERYVHEMAEFAPYGIVNLINKKPVYVNRFMLELLGVNNIEDLINRNPISFIHPNDRISVLNAIENVSVCNSTQNHKLSIIGLDLSGNQKYLDVRFQCLDFGQTKRIQIVVFDISEQIEKEKNLAKLTTLSLHMNQYDDDFIKIKKELEEVIVSNNLDNGIFKDVIGLLSRHKSFQKVSGHFFRYFESIHPDFFEKLNVINPNLTVNDIKHCACIRMNYETKEIADLFNISPAAVQKNRVRLKKKLSVPGNKELREFIRSI
jgi:DNA-binding CsgD family transcriptional regulator